MKSNKTETRRKMGKMKTLANNQPQNKKTASAGKSQSTSNNAGTAEYTVHSGPTDIDRDVGRHFTTGKLIFNSVAI